MNDLKQDSMLFVPWGGGFNAICAIMEDDEVA
jgi:hypothetical protein